MRFVFKTSYNQDIQLFKHEGYWWSYGILFVVVATAPLYLGDFEIAELSQAMSFAVAGLGLMLLVGFTGQVSLGHAAFFGIGAYAQAWLLSVLPISFLVAMPIAAAMTGIIGLLLAIPLLRMTGIYLAIGTLALSIVLEQILKNWKSVTGGFDGKAVEPASIMGYQFNPDSWDFYYVSLAILILVLVICANLLRSPTGRAMVAVRDSEISARSMGVNVARTRITAYAISTAITGLGGALFAHKLQYLAPDGFNLIISITFLLMIVVGGLGSLQGAVLGALVVTLIPQAITVAKDYLPDAIAHQPGLEPGIFGLILVVFILYEPLGIYGRWRKLKLFFDIFPIYRKATFKRQKVFLKTERMR
ncbi:MAG: branched-chain amino acid ABC transporter permease [Rhodospirillaceae bacterium]|nr:branched-chain amino acid ABC transporter permease [Rhodospirillaceae bacterium]